MKVADSKKQERRGLRSIQKELIKSFCGVMRQQVDKRSRRPPTYCGGTLRTGPCFPFQSIEPSSHNDTSFGSDQGISFSSSHHNIDSCMPQGCRTQDLAFRLNWPIKFLSSGLYFTRSQKATSPPCFVPHLAASPTQIHVPTTPQPALCILI
jgi:hypothetical protein